MGKGTIISHIGDGQYYVELNYDRSKIDTQISLLSNKITQYQDVIDNPDSTKIQILTAKINRLSAEKRKSYLESANVPDDETVIAWCADFTLDLSGEVGTIEVCRDRNEGVNIQPGYNSNDDYSSVRDGQLVPSMALSPEGTYYNLAMLPGTQKWKPQYRYGTITAIDGSTCTVSLYSVSSSQQALNINQLNILTDVPFKYMTCDASAFSIGDDVLVEFTDFDIETPVIIGFKNNPKSCEIGMIIVVSSQSGNECVAWDAVTDTQYGLGGTFDSVVSQLADDGYTALSELKISDRYTSTDYYYTSSIVDNTWEWNPVLNVPFSFADNVYWSGQEAFKPYTVPLLYEPETEDWTYCYMRSGCSLTPGDPNELTVVTNYPYIQNPDSDEESERKAPFLMNWSFPSAPMWYEYHICHFIFDRETDSYSVDENRPSYPYNIIENMSELLVDASWNTNDSDPDYRSWVKSGIATVEDQGAAVYEYFAYCDGWDFINHESFSGSYDNIFHVFAKKENALTGKALECFNVNNTYRQSIGAPELIVNLNLLRAAERHAEDCATNMIESHVGSDGSTIESRVTDSGYFLYIGAYGTTTMIAENGAFNYTAEAALVDWLNSPEHKANLDNSDLLETGIGVFERPDGRFTWIQVFGYREGTWPGFGPIGTGLKTYIDNNFNWLGVGDNERLPKVYLA